MTHRLVPTLITALRDDTPIFVIDPEAGKESLNTEANPRK